MAPSASIYCPYCRQHTALSQALNHSAREVPAIWRDPRNGDSWWIGICNYCFQPCLVKNDAQQVYPNPIPEPTDERVPEPIRKDLDEAKACFAINAFRAAAIMARRTIQSVVHEHGHTAGNLMNQIDAMAAAGQITHQIKEWAHEVRFVGNDAAHPNGVEVGKADAEVIIELAKQLLQNIYVAPSIAQQLRAARTPP
jgi:hypothetical protein